MTNSEFRHITIQSRGYLRKNGYLRLQQVLDNCRTLYNAALQERRDAWRMQRVRISRIDQMKQLTLVRNDDPNWGGLHLNIGRGVLCRVDRAFNSFFRRVKNGEKPGFPRFKGRHRYSCIELDETKPGMVKLGANDRKAFVRVKGLPTVTIKPSRPLPDSKYLKCLRINLRPTGVDVDLVYQVPKIPTEPKGREVGADFGVNKRITLSDGNVITPREIDRAKEETLRRTVSRSQKGSNRRKKKAKTLSRECRRNKVRNRNECHRITTSLVRNYSAIAVEDLNIRNMTRSAAGTVENPGKNVAAKTGLNRAILEQTWGIIYNQLSYKAEWAGTVLVEVNARNTSKICSMCGEVRRERLDKYRIFRCRSCGLTLDRDVNAAINIRNRAFGPEEQGGNSPAAPWGRGKQQA